MINYVNLGDIAKIDWGNTNLTKSSYSDNGEYLGVSAAGCDGRMNHFEHEVGTLVISAIGANCGRMFFPTEKFTAIKNTITITPKIDIDSKYLFYYLDGDSFIRRGAGQPFIAKKDTEIKLVPLPPLPQQQKIANILDAADALRQNDKALVAKYDELTQALFLDMFGDLNNNRKFPISIIEDIVEIVRDGPHVSPKYSDSGIPILSTRNIRPFELIKTDLKYVSKEMYEVLTKRFKPQKDDILLTKGGTTGFAKIVDWDWDFCIWVHLAALRVKKDKIIPKYLEASLNSNYCYNQSQRLTKGIANKDLGLKQMIKIEIVLPPLTLQNQFTERVAAIEEQKAIAQASLIKSEELFNSLLQKAFKGELV